MAFPQADVFFPGITQVESFEYCLEHGVTPGVATLTIAPQENLPAKTGNLVMAYGKFRQTLKDFIVDTLSFRYDQNGRLWRLRLLDGRWKWRYGTLTGKYNERLPHGPVHKINPITEATPTTLFQEIFKAMGVKRFNIAELPDLRPFVHWDAANPAQELADLADRLGMRVVYRTDGTVAICPVGRGGISGDREPLLPDGPIIQDSGTFDPPERPDEIHFVCGPTRFQADFPMDAVGDDVDGLIKPINDLSYAPKKKGAGGAEGKAVDWSRADIVFFRDVPLLAGGGIGNWQNYVSPRELARQSVYRKYRIRAYFKKPDGKKPIKVEGYDKPLQDVRQVLPIADELLEPTFDPDTGWFRPVTSILWGNFASGDSNNQDPPDDFGDIDAFKPPIIFQPRDPETGQQGFRYDATVVPPEQWTIDAATGVVTISKQLILIGSPASLTERRYLPAILYLRTAVTVNDWTTLVPVRKTIKRTMPGPVLGTGPHIVRDDDIFLRVVPEYSPGRPESSKNAPTDNLDVIKKYAKERLDAEQKKFQTKGPRHVTYAGWIKIEPDGAVVQAAWSMGKDGAFTQGALNDEIAVLTVPYQERRFLEKLRNDKLDRLLDDFNRNIGERGYPFSPLSNVTRGR